MKTFRVAVRLLAVWALFASGARLSAQFGASDRTLSPYFLVKSDGSETALMPLRSTEVEANIAGSVADVTVRQVYVNQSDRTLEALYVFPASTRAAVYNMTMTVGTRTLKAKAEDRRKARATYEAAKEEGKRATLLEQDRPNVFRMQLANIKPGDSISLEMGYVETLLPVDGIYEFVYPTVVAPRYTGKSNYEAAKSDGLVSFDYLEPGQKQRFTFDFKARIDAGVPIRKLSSPSHKIESKPGKKHARRLRLAPSERNNATKDFIVRYELGGLGLASGLLRYEQGDEGYFMATIQPPAETKQADAPPTEFVFLLDASGSMQGFPLRASKEFIKSVVGNMRPTDKFNVILFDLRPKPMSEQPVAANKENVEKAFDFLNSGYGGGGTKLLPALNAALANSSDDRSVSRSVVVITDGHVTVENEAMKTISKRLGDANLFAMGAGANVNRFIIESMARAGNGEPIFITRPEEAEPKAKAFARYVSNPALTGIEVAYDGFTPYGLNLEAVPDVLANRPVVLYGKCKPGSTGKITLTGTSGGGKFSQTLSLADFPPEARNSGLRYLWARETVANLHDKIRLRASSETKMAIVNIGLEHNLLTPYTSFIAVEEGKEDQIAYRLPGAEAGGPNANEPQGGGRTFNARALGNSKVVDLLMPTKSKYYKAKAMIQWKAYGEGPQTYLVTFSNLFGEQVKQVETQETSLVVDLNAEPYAKERGLMYEVSVKGEGAKSERAALSALKQAQQQEANAAIAEFIGDDSAEARLGLAQVYERYGFFAHALLVYQDLQTEGDQYQQAYRAFLKKFNVGG